MTGQASAAGLALEAYLAQVAQANLTIEAARARAKALEHRIKPASMLDDPFIAVGIDEIPFGGGDGSVTRYQISQTIPFPGKLGARDDAAERRAQSAQADTETTRRTLLVVATQTYYRTYFNHKEIALNEVTKRYIQQAIDSTKARYKTGGEGHHEWLLGKVELGVIDAQRLRLVREQKSLHALLNELRNETPESPIEISEASFDSFKEPNADKATQPEILASLGVKEAADADERAAKLSYFPDFVIQGMAMKPRMSEGGDMPTSDIWGVMVGVSLPIFFWRRQSHQGN